MSFSDDLYKWNNQWNDLERNRLLKEQNAMLEQQRWDQEWNRTCAEIDAEIQREAQQREVESERRFQAGKQKMAELAGYAKERNLVAVRVDPSLDISGIYADKIAPVVLQPFTDFCQKAAKEDRYFNGNDYALVFNCKAKLKTINGIAASHTRHFVVFEDTDSIFILPTSKIRERAAEGYEEKFIDLPPFSHLLFLNKGEIALVAQMLDDAQQAAVRTIDAIAHSSEIAALEAQTASHIADLQKQIDAVVIPYYTKTRYPKATALSWLMFGPAVALLTGSLFGHSVFGCITAGMFGFLLGALLGYLRFLLPRHKRDKEEAKRKTEAAERERDALIRSQKELSDSLPRKRAAIIERLISEALTNPSPSGKGENAIEDNTESVYHSLQEQERSAEEGQSMQQPEESAQNLNKRTIVSAIVIAVTALSVAFIRVTGNREQTFGFAATETAGKLTVTGWTIGYTSTGTIVDRLARNVFGPEEKTVAIPAALIIPAEIGGVPVVGIDESAFQHQPEITSVTIPDSVTYIGNASFRDCTSLTSITIPNSVTSIEDSAFQGCASLTSVTIPNSVTSIGTSAFQGCTSLTSVTIPNSVTSIGDYVFLDCASLASVTIPNSVTSIGNSTFQRCASLASVTIPNSVTSIGNSAFRDCTSLTSVTIGNSVTSIGNFAFYNCASLASVTFIGSATVVRYNLFPSNATSLISAGGVRVGDNMLMLAGTYTRNGEIWTKSGS
jgi:hypothetical protein